MKRLVLLFLMLCGALGNANAQSLISKAQWEKLDDCLNEEKWRMAADLSKRYLSGIPDDKIDGSDAASLRYMNIIAEAGLMNQKQLSQEDASKNAKAFEGRTVMMPGRKLTLKEGFNTIDLLNDGKADTLTVTAANKAATDIFTFEYIISRRPLSLASLNEKKDDTCYIKGILKLIKVEGKAFPRFKLIVDQAELSFDE